MSVDHDLGTWTDQALSLAQASPTIDHAEVRAEIVEDQVHVVRSGDLARVNSGYISGLGVRARCGDGTGYAYVNEISRSTIASAVERASQLACANAAGDWDRMVGEPARADRRSYSAEVSVDPHEAETDEIHSLLRRAEDGIHETAPEAKTQVGLGSRREHRVLETTSGLRVDTELIHSSLLVQCVVRDDGRRGQGNDWVGGERGLEDYSGDADPATVGRRVGAQAIESLRAEPIDPGRYRVLCDHRLTGVLVHESFGHLTEYDLVAPGWSVLQDRLGDQLARADLTIRDVPSWEEGAGDGVAVPFDQEGTRGEPVTVLDDGRLTGFLHRRGTADAAEAKPTGNGRALNVHHPPIVRMRNTYMEPGDLSVEEALELLDDGIYLTGGVGGAPRCDGSFTFTAQGGYRVEDGEIVDPVRMTTIHGNVLDFLQGVEGRTDTVRMDTSYFGGCGKWGQNNLPVGIGGPQVVIEEALLGGQGA